MARNKSTGERRRAKRQKRKERKLAQLRRLAARIERDTGIDVMAEAASFAMLWQRLPELAQRETRSVQVLGQQRGIPAGEYAFAELYCTKPGCDCRRVLFNVLRRPLESTEDTAPQHVATIGYGWEPVSFYQAWLLDDEMGRDMKGPLIEPDSPACDYDHALLNMFEDLCLSSPAYVERLTCHYRLFKDTLEALS